MHTHIHKEQASGFKAKCLPELLVLHLNVHAIMFIQKLKSWLGLRKETF